MQTIEKEEEKKEQLITYDIKQKSKLKISKEKMNEIFYSIGFAVILMVYFYLLIIANRTIIRTRLEKDIQVFAGMIMIVGLYFTEKAYNKEKGSRGITAIECFVLSFHSLSITYIIKKYNFDFSIYLGASAYIFASYCTLKAIIIYTKGRKQLLENISDVKEIVKKEEPIKKEATKRIKNEEEPEKVQQKSKTTENKKSTNSKTTNKSKKTSAKTASKPKTTNLNETENKTKKTSSKAKTTTSKTKKTTSTTGKTKNTSKKKTSKSKEE